jgi:4-hydroxy-L-threonine phosphate dehydrogenase PdxA
MSHLDLNSAEKNLLGANAENIAVAANLPDSGAGGRFGNYEELMQMANLIESGRSSRENHVGTSPPPHENSFIDPIGAD